MTSLGQRPSLAELIVILASVVNVEADQDALNPESKTFRVVLTFNRELMRDIRGWGDGQPTPSHLMDEIYSHLAQWQTQRAREAQWVSKEGELGSIDGLIAHYTTELHKALDKVLETVTTRVQRRVLSSTVLRLQELKERRAAGGVYNATENRREKARKQWADDEFEAPNREKAQAEARARADKEYGDGIFNEFFSDHLHRTYREHYEKIFGQAFGGGRQPPKPSTGKKRWHEVLGVAVGASKSDIQKAYRKLVAQYHPDRYKGTDAHEKMAEINAARDEALGGL